MNKAIIIGNLARDPEIRTTQGGVSVCTFTVAVQRRFKNDSGERVADFIPVVAWRQLGENCGKYLAKGRKVAVSGAIQVRTYDANDGSKRYVTEIVADDVQFLTSREGGGRPDLPEAPPDTGMSGFTDIEDEELPF